MAEFKDFSLVELIESHETYARVKNELKDLEPDSDEYVQQLMDKTPLSLMLPRDHYMNNQSIVLQHTKKKGFSPVFRSILSEKHLLSCVSKRINTGYEHFQLTVRTYPRVNCVGWRPYDEKTKCWEPYYVYQDYATINKRAINFGSGILALVNAKLGKPINNNDFIVSLLSYNRPEWIITDLACQSYSVTNTSLYETLGPETSEYIMNLTESPVLVFAKTNLTKVVDNILRFKFINTLICLDELTAEELDLLNEHLLRGKENIKNEKINLFTMSQVERIGELTPIPVIPPTPDSLYTISFTSGTTGMPKGVELTHRNMVAGTVLCLSLLHLDSPSEVNEIRDICFLPLAHIFQRMILSIDLAKGYTIGFLHKPDPSVLVEDLKLFKPRSVSLVPRILTRFEAGIKNGLGSSKIKNYIASSIIEAKKRRFTTTNGEDNSLINSILYHHLLIDTIKESLGLDETSYIITGSAPISNDTLVFLKSALDIAIRQGYGLTETFAGICISEAFEKDSGSCGGIGPTTECRLRSVPEMNYDAEKDFKGEIQVRGPQIFQGYYKNQEETAASLDEDGWFSTGDVGMIDSKGRLNVIDRVKNFFKLSHGEYIAPEKIENTYLSSCPYITQIFVYGSSFERYLVGIVGLDVAAVRGALTSKVPGLQKLSDEKLLEEINKNPKLKRKAILLINSFVKGLQGFETMHNIFVSVEPLRVEDNTVTPTFKIKRAFAGQYFKDILDDLYKEGSVINEHKL